MLGPDVADKYEKVADVDEDGAIWFRVMKWADGQHITDVGQSFRQPLLLLMLACRSIRKVATRPSIGSSFIIAYVNRY
jgi:hypothetical protein